MRAIKNKKEHRLALKRIEELWDAKPGTPAGNELDILSTLVEQYEENNRDIAPPTPLSR